MSWFFFLLIVTVPAGALLLLKARLEARNRDWDGTARELGLRWFGNRIDVEIDGLRATIWREPGCVLAAVDGPSIPLSFGLVDAATALSESYVPDFLTGDGVFDRQVRVTGDRAHALAVLDSETRRLVLRVIVHGGARLDGGRVIQRGSRLREVVCRLDDLVALAKRLRMPAGEVAERLARNVESDRNTGVRFHSLCALTDRYPDTAACRRAGVAALRSGDPELRLEAAIRIGHSDTGTDADADEGARADPIAVVCAIVADASASVGLRIRALEHLAQPASAARAIPVLEAAASVAPTRLRCAAIAGLARLHHRAAVELFDRLADQASYATAAAIAAALEQIGDPAGERCLLRLLRRRDAEVVGVAVRALGAIGSPAAVEPLLELAERYAVRSVRTAAWVAVERIQGRLSGAERGQLSLARAGHLEGAVSPAAEVAPGGELSLADGEGPQRGGA